MDTNEEHIAGKAFTDDEERAQVLLRRDALQSALAVAAWSLLDSPLRVPSHRRRVVAALVAALVWLVCLVMIGGGIHVAVVLLGRGDIAAMFTDAVAGDGIALGGILVASLFLGGAIYDLNQVFMTVYDMVAHE